MLAQYMGVITTLPLRRAYYFRLLDNRTSYHDRSGLFDRRGRPKPALAYFRQRWMLGNGGRVSGFDRAFVALGFKFTLKYSIEKVVLFSWVFGTWRA